MTTGTMTNPTATGLSECFGINAKNRARRLVPAPRTCLISELYCFCERNNIVLTKSVLKPEDGWLYLPGSAAKDVMHLDYDPPGVLFLQDGATRRDQMEVLHHLGGAL